MKSYFRTSFPITGITISQVENCLNGLQQYLLDKGISGLELSLKCPEVPARKKIPMICIFPSSSALSWVKCWYQAYNLHVLGHLVTNIPILLNWFEDWLSICSKIWYHIWLECVWPISSDCLFKLVKFWWTKFWPLNPQELEPEMDFLV